MPPFEARRGSFIITTDPARHDARAIHAALRGQYWCEGIPLSTVERALRHSLGFALLDESADPPALAGFGRVISDFATYGYLGDVFITGAFRGRGLGKWLIATILDHPDLQGLRRFALMTRDAHELYARFGFRHLPDASRYMDRHDPGIYSRPSP